MFDLLELNHLVIYALTALLLALISFGIGRWPFYDRSKDKFFWVFFLFFAPFFIFVYRDFIKLIRLTDLFFFGFISLTYFLLGFYRKYNSGSTLWEGGSEHQNLFVRENVKEKKRWMATERGLMAGINLETRMPLSPYYFLSDIINPGATSALFLGGGPCVMPTYVWKNYPKMKVSVVEIDPLTIKLAQKFFNLHQDNRYSIFITDARSFLSKDKSQFDIIFLDLGLSKETAFTSSSLSICTLEAVRLLKKNLKRSGVSIVNVITAIDGPESQFFKDCYLTFKKVFRNIYIFPDRVSEPKRIQDVIFLLTPKKIDLELIFKKRLEDNRLKHSEDLYFQLMEKMYRVQMGLSQAKILHDRDQDRYFTA